MKPRIITFILVFWSSTYGDESRSNLQKVKEGLGAGKAILDALKGSSNSETIGKLATISGKIAPFLGAVGPVFSLVSLFYPSSEMTYMKKEFRKLNSRIDKVFYELGEIKELIEKSSLKMQYSSYEHTILSLSSKLQDYLNSNANNAHTFKRIFVNEYKYNFNGAAQKLYNGMIKNSNVFSLDIPYTAMKFTNYHRRRTQNIMKGTLNLIIQGVKVTLAYHEAEGISVSDYKALKNVWDRKIKRLVQHIQRKDMEVKNEWRDQLSKDVDSKLKQYSGWNNKDFNNKLYKFLTDKYDWRLWLVVVYNPISGWWYHSINHCGGLHRFRQNGRNTLVASVYKSKQPVSHSTTKSRFYVKNLCRHTLGWWVVPASHSCIGASDIYNAQDEVLRKGCSTYASLGVIKDRHGLSIKGAPGRVVYQYGGGSTIFAFS